jgi:hypothetical protein
LQENNHLKLELIMRRNYHPHISSTYINGYVKDQSLQNFDDNEVLNWLKKVNSEFGRRALKHNSEKVVTERKSIQGQWTDTTWGFEAKHMMENKRDIPYRTIDPVPLREKMFKKERPHRLTAIARKKYVLP